MDDLKQNAPTLHEMMRALLENPDSNNACRSEAFKSSKDEREAVNIGSVTSAYLNLRSNHRLSLRATKCGLGLRALGKDTITFTGYFKTTPPKHVCHGCLI